MPGVPPGSRALPITSASLWAAVEAIESQDYAALSARCAEVARHLLGAREMARRYERVYDEVLSSAA